MSLRSRNKVNVNFSMSSMTDIVFLLLIFLLITSNFVKHNALNILIPNTPKEEIVKKVTVSVSITEDLQYFVDKDKVAFEQLPAMLQQKVHGKDDPNVMIFVHQQVPTQNTLEVVSAINKLGYSASVATDPRNK